MQLQGRATTLERQAETHQGRGEPVAMAMLRPVGPRREAGLATLSGFGGPAKVSDRPRHPLPPSVGRRRLHAPHIVTLLPSCDRGHRRLTPTQQAPEPVPAWTSTWNVFDCNQDLRAGRRQNWPLKDLSLDQLSKDQLSKDQSCDPLFHRDHLDQWLRVSCAIGQGAFP